MKALIPIPKTQDLRPKVLVTGAKGQLGYKINQLMSDQFDLILTDAQEMDITDKSKVHKVIKSIKPDWIIHGAAYTKVDQAEDEVELCERINTVGTKNLAEVANELNIPIIYISTDFVFDGKKKTPYTESDQANPLSVYGRTKYEGEKNILGSNKNYVVRVSWLFGELPPDYLGTNFVETMIRLGRERDSLNVVNDQIGSPTYTKDLVEVINKIVGSKELGGRSNNTSPSTPYTSSVPYGLYHFSGGGECSWYDFAKKIFELAKIDIDLKPISSAEYPQKAKRPAYSYMSKKKIGKALNIKVRTWQEMLGDYLSYKVDS